MVCLIKSKYEEELNHLTEVLGSYKRAYAVLCCNNGYTLDKTKEGKSSKLYNDLLEYYKGDVNKAEQKKAQLFTSDFTDTYGKWFQDGFEIQEQYKDVFDENGEPILFRSGKQTQEQNYLENPYFGTSNDKILLEEKSENFEQPYDAERFATSEQRMVDQYILENANRDSEGRLLAPNGKPSHLTEKQYVQVRTKAFKAWFGDWEKEYTPPRQYNLSTWERTGEYVNILKKDFLGNTYSISTEILYHPVERKETTKEDPFGFNSIGVSKVIKVGTLVNRSNPLNGICQYTAQRIQAFLKDRYGIEVHTNIIDAKSPVTGEIMSV